MKHHIFIVDDEASIRDLLGKFLTGCGYEVTPIETVHEALKSVHKRTPDLIISDLQLEDGDGLEMIGRIKNEFPDIPVILLTGVLFDHEVVDQVLRTKVTCYLEKTSPLAKIKQTVESLLPPAT
jgi:DNA-binding NtrC family response regulator|uniref:response regulator n=1 Tax=Cephaloticoccus sp. TaxID=1985742 RepID=UPI00404B6DB5